MQLKPNRAPRCPLVSSEHRDALHGAALFNVEGTADDVVRVLGKGDVEEALRLRQRIEDGFRLLDDLGWHPLDGRETYELTMPAERLAHFARWHKEGAESDLASWSPRSVGRSTRRRATGVTRTPSRTTDF